MDTYSELVDRLTALEMAVRGGEMLADNRAVANDRRMSHIEKQITHGVRRINALEKAKVSEEDNNDFSFDHINARLGKLVDRLQEVEKKISNPGQEIMDELCEGMKEEFQYENRFNADYDKPDMSTAAGRLIGLSQKSMDHERILAAAEEATNDMMDAPEMRRALEAIIRYTHNIRNNIPGITPEVMLACERIEDMAKKGLGQ